MRCVLGGRSSVGGGEGGVGGGEIVWEIVCMGGGGEGGGRVQHGLVGALPVMVWTTSILGAQSEVCCALHA